VSGRIRESETAVLRVEHNLKGAFAIAHRGDGRETGRIALADAGGALLHRDHARSACPGS
jgi:ABC-type branched-subunit amino acid transport system ATPase component